MAEPARADGSASIAASVLVEGRAPYAMFEVIELTATAARLRGPLMLEVGEHLGLRLKRGDRVADVEGRIASIARDGGHGDPITVVELLDAGAVGPFLS
jgi:hypothetical protein